MKNKIIGCVGLTFLWCSLTLSTNAFGADFSSTVDWGGLTASDGTTYTVIGDIGNLLTWTWDQTIQFDPDAVSVTSATLALTHMGNADNPNQRWGEIWVLSGGQEDTKAVKIGELGNSLNGWTTTTFGITDLFAGFQGESITFALKLSETTRFIDILALDKCIISGQYTPVPIPGSALLLGSSLLGLVGIGSRKKRTRI